MGSYITAADIRDDVLSCTEDDIAKANAYIEWSAARLGVSAAKIASPAPFAALRLGECYACYIRALAKVGTDATVTVDGERGQEGDDIYAQKLKLYRAELDRLEASLTAADFTGEGGSGAKVTYIGRA